MTSIVKNLASVEKQIAAMEAKITKMEDANTDINKVDAVQEKLDALYEKRTAMLLGSDAPEETPADPAPEETPADPAPEETPAEEIVAAPAPADDVSEPELPDSTPIDASTMKVTELEVPELTEDQIKQAQADLRFASAQQAVVKLLSQYVCLTQTQLCKLSNKTPVSITTALSDLRSPKYASKKTGVFMTAGFKQANHETLYTKM